MDTETNLTEKIPANLVKAQMDLYNAVLLGKSGAALRRDIRRMAKRFLTKEQQKAAENAARIHE